MTDRPHLPAEISRAVKDEAGHRCAIPVCHQVPVDVAHIVPRDGTNDVFENLIALCPNCHRRYDRGDFDRKSMRQYKANLAVMNGRYCEFERRVLETFAERPDEQGALLIPGSMDIMLKRLIQDGYALLHHPSELGMPSMDIGGVPSQAYVSLTDAGRAFIAHWLQAEDLEAT